MIAEERVTQAELDVANSINAFAAKIREAEAEGVNVWDFIADAYDRYGISLGGEWSPLYSLAEKLATDNVDAIRVNSDERSGEYVIQLVTVQRGRFTIRAVAEVLVPAPLALFEAAWESGNLDALLSLDISRQLEIAL